jgi:hypothetical protein
VTPPEDPPVRLREADVVWRTVDDEVIVLDTRTWSYVSVNDTGGVLWDSLVAGATVGELAAKLSAAFGIDEATARADAGNFVDALDRHGLLER